MSLIRRAGTVGGLTLLSRLFGFGRDVVMAAVLGAGPLADAFMVAFRLPNHFRAIFAEGAFNSAFIPTYAALRTREGEAEAVSFRSTILSWSLAANTVLLLVALAATGWVVVILAPGLGDDPDQHDLAVALTRITFPYLSCMAVVTLLSGVLNAHDRFAAAAAAPILLNVAMTAALLAASSFPSAAHAAAWGVLAGGMLQVAFVAMASAQAGLRFTLSLPRLDPAVTTFFKRFGPAILGAGGVQIAMFADTIIATSFPPGRFPTSIMPTASTSCRWRWSASRSAPLSCRIYPVGLPIRGMRRHLPRSATRSPSAWFSASPARSDWRCSAIW